MSKVKVFSMESCSHCEVLKQFLKEHNIEFEDINVIKDKKGEEELLQKSGQESLPVIEINDEVIVGFDQKRIKKLLNL